MWEIRNACDTFANEHLDEIYVSEDYIPVQVTDTLLVLLTLDECDIAEDEEDDEDVD